jgi:hypothetical protein
MTAEEQAVVLVNEVRRERGGTSYTEYTRLRRDHDDANEALCRAIEQHEAFKQEVSDAVEKANTPTEILCLCGRKNAVAFIRLDQFIIPKPKPDPLVEVIKAMQAEPTTYVTSEVYANRINAALDALGFEIREKGQ